MIVIAMLFGAVAMGSRTIPDQEGTEIRRAERGRLDQGDGSRTIPDQEGTEIVDVLQRNEVPAFAAERSPIRRGLKFVSLQPRRHVPGAAERSPIRRGLKFDLLTNAQYGGLQQNDPRSGGD